MYESHYGIGRPGACLNGIGLGWVDSSGKRKNKTRAGRRPPLVPTVNPRTENRMPVEGLASGYPQGLQIERAIKPQSNQKFHWMVGCPIQQHVLFKCCQRERTEH